MFKELKEIILRCKEKRMISQHIKNINKNVKIVTESNMNIGADKPKNQGKALLHGISSIFELTKTCLI
jgi:hypothetical protein